MSAQESANGIRLLVDDTAEAIAFYTAAFDAVVSQVECLLDGQVLCAELAIGAHRLTIDGIGAPHRRDISSALSLECDDHDSAVHRAVAAGARIELSDAGSSRTVVRDPAGQRWTIVARPLVDGVDRAAAPDRAWGAR